MARQDLTVTAGTTRNPTAAVVLTLTAEDATNHSRFVLTTRDILVIQNTGAGSHTVTIYGPADERSRTGDITTQSIAAGAVAMIGPFDLTGWAQPTGGYLNIDGNHAELKFGIYRMPG